MTAYDRLATRFERITTMGEASSMLNWDAATMMPPGGGARAAISSRCLPVCRMRCWSRRRSPTILPRRKPPEKPIRGAPPICA